jgi:G3E family GTPase
VPQSRWPDHQEWLASLRSRLEPVWGDRRQKIIFIGTGAMDEANLRRSLNACPLPVRRVDPAARTNLPDPFPSWG